MSKLLPFFQKQIVGVYDSLNLSNERRAILNPLVEKQIEFVSKPDGNAGTVISATVVDENHKVRDGVSIADMVKEVHEKTKDDGIPVVENKNLTEKQLQDIASGKLGIKTKREAVDKDAIPGSTILKIRPSLEDIASGKIKVDINR